MVSFSDLNYRHLQYFWTVAREGSVVAAAARLHLQQPTLSMQIGKLEARLGCKLFERSGRRLVLTETGQAVYQYADEIFSLGERLVAMLEGRETGHPLRLTVGVPDAMPKLLTYRLLRPALELPTPVELECFEAKFDQLLADLAADRFDVVLSDAPLGVGARIRAYNHPLGECGIAICGVEKLARRFRKDFPHSLHGAPFLLPTPNNDLRRSLEQWFDAQGLQPRVTAEFDDSALMKEFGVGGVGLFPVPAVVLKDVMRQYRVRHVGTIDSVRARFFAITNVRKLKHPAVLAVCNAARQRLLVEPA